ncbi:amidase [Pseudohalocynthiibacter aestuariivivens]|nr:amidase family protein [Pseudohalocynthiibacter aestuariivivens]QIE46002.1 amidase [Pseudohalocynthiibacter aestuariivivens]
MTTQISQMSASALVRAYERRELSPVEVVYATYDRIDSVNPKINAIYHQDREGALSAARDSEQRWLSQTPLGLLDGVPTTIKDALATTGMPSYRGSAAGHGEVATTDHPTVARMRQAGALIVGKNTMCDYGILAAGISSRHGITRNPWDLSCTTGASSSGAAASVAAGVEPLSVGTDIVGSIRLPASFCGLAGLKPSQGRVPYYKCNSPALTAGPLARSFADLALHMNVLTGPDGRDFTALAQDNTDYTRCLHKANLHAARVLVVTELGLGAPVQREVETAVLDVADVLSQLGATIDFCEAPPFDRNDWQPAEAFYKVRTLSELSEHADSEARKSTVIWDWTRDALTFSAVDHQRNFDLTQRLRERAHALIRGYDFLILPSTPQTAFGAELAGANPERIFESWANTFLFNLSEQPCSNIPVGLDDRGLPIGVQVVGKRFHDQSVLSLSWQVEQVVGQMPPAPI